MPSTTSGFSYRSALQGLRQKIACFFRNVTEASSGSRTSADEAAEHEPMRAELEADGLLRVTVAKAKAVDVEVRQL